jgi:hypothetical protein
MWIIRAYLVLAAAGVDKAFLFEIRDETKNASLTSPDRFATSGLLGHPTENYRIKLAWYYVMTLSSRLRGLRYYDDTLSSGNVTIYRYMFTCTENDVHCFHLCFDASIVSNQ